MGRDIPRSRCLTGQAECVAHVRSSARAGGLALCFFQSMTYVL
jgi:hypothetical protein